MAEKTEGQKQVVESCIAYCGLDCSICPIKKGEIADLAKTLLDKLNETEFEKIAKGLADTLMEFSALSNYDEFIEVLQAFDSVRCSSFCREGGGTAFCPIKACCSEKGFEGCWLCNEIEGCRTLSLIDNIRGGEHLNNLKIIKEKIDKT